MRGFFSVPIIVLAIEAALLAASLMLWTTNSAIESAALPVELVDFLDAVGDLAAEDLAAEDLAAGDLAAADLPAAPVGAFAADFAALGLAARESEAVLPVDFDAALEAAFDALDFAAEAAFDAVP